MGGADVGNEAPLVVGLRIVNDDVTIAYAGDGLAALLDAAEVRESLHVAARTSTPWRHAWTVDGRRLQGVALPIADDRGVTLHGYVRDVTEQGGSRFQGIVEASPVPYAINDELQNITYVNPAFVATFGYTREDIPTLDEWWPRAYPDVDYRRWVATEWSERLGRAKQANTPFAPFEVKIRAKDGADRFALVGALSLESAFRGEHAVVLLDVTERKRAEDARLGLERQVQHSQKLESLGVLAGGIAHDF